jgi:hypothetical protein
MSVPCFRNLQEATVFGSVPVLFDNLPEQITPGATWFCFLAASTAVSQQISQSQVRFPELGVCLLNFASKKSILVLVQYQENLKKVAETTDFKFSL